jgi:transcription antitermination factor NusG
MSTLTQFSRANSTLISPSIPKVIPAHWTVLQVKSRQEKALAHDLAAKNIQHYLPLIKKTQFYGGRRFVVDLPLFAGYVFLRGSVEDVYAADRTRRVSKIIDVFDQSQLEQELSNLKLALEGSELLLPYPYLKKGVRVEVRSGPFRGLQGLVEQRTGANRLILQIEMLGRAVSLEIGAAELELVE